MTEQSEPPLAQRRPTTHEAHGVLRADPYAWLRDTADPAVLAYLSAERRHYDTVTGHLGHLRTELADELLGRTPAADSSVRWRRGECVYYTDTVPGQEYRRLNQIDTRRGDPDPAASRVVLDPNVVAEQTGSGYVGIGVEEPSPDGRLLAWSVDLRGDEVYALRFRDLATGRDLPEVVERSYYTGAWSADSAWFFYTVHDELFRPHRVLRHRLGTDPAQDVEVLREDDQRFELEVAASRDGGWVVVTAANRDTTQVHLLDARDPLAPPRLVAPRRPGVEYRVSVLPGGWAGAGDDLLLLVTNDEAPEFALCTAPLPPPGGTGDAATWVRLDGLVAGDGSERLETAEVFAGHVVLALRRDARPLLRVLARTPGDDPAAAFEVAAFEVAGPPCGRIALWRNEDYAATAVVVVEEDMVTTTTWSSVDLRSGARQVLRRTEVPGVDLARYATTRIHVPAADGTPIPVTIAHLAGAVPDRTHPVLLYGYGAYEVCLWPEFEVPVLSLLDRGVVYAVAHVRGGGEGGRSWWQQGRLLAKPNTFDDFVAARDGLVAAGWAAPDAVASRGLSAGGLLQAAAFTRAPDRWRAVLAEVPFVDVVTTMSDPTIPLTVNEWDEWGDPRILEEFTAMLGWSPYDHVEDVAGAAAAGTRLPDLLVTGALHDPRVLVHEPAKWVAALRHAVPAGAASGIVFRVETGEGAHSGPSGRLAHLHYEAEVLAWVLDRLEAG